MLSLRDGTVREVWERLKWSRVGPGSLEEEYKSLPAWSEDFLFEI